MSQNLIVWADIRVRDLPRAVAFYSKVLAAEVAVQKMEGFEFGLLPHPGGHGPGACLMPLEESEPLPSRDGPLVYLSVNGRLDEAEEAAKNGGEVLKSKHPIGPWGFRTVIVDTEGNRIALHSETA